MGRNPLCVEVASDPIAALALHEFSEDASNHDTLGWLDFPPPGLGVIDVPEKTASCALWQTTAPGTRSFATHRALHDLFPLHFCNEGPCRENEAADRCVLEVLGYELEPRPSLLDLVEEDADVVLVTRQAINGIGQHHLHRVGAEGRPDSIDTWPLDESEAARGFLNAV